MNADNMAEAFKRSNGNVLFDFREAEGIELLTAPGGLVWVNIDGVCAIRIYNCKSVLVDTSNATELGKTIMPVETPSGVSAERAALTATENEAEPEPKGD